MATIHRFAACKIAIYADHHTPPHFHAVVEIDTMMVRFGDVRRAADAMAWARKNAAMLRDAWMSINRRG